MNNEQIIPNKSKSDTPTFSVFSEGKAVSPTYQFLAIAIVKEVNRIPTAKLVIRDGEASESDFAFSNKADFAPGSKIELKSGMDGDDDTAFKGIVIKHSIKVRENGDAHLIIECKDESVKMTIGRHNKYYEDNKDSDIISELLGKHGVKGKVDATKVKHKEVVQHYCTDWDFVLSRAEMNGLLIIVDDGKVNVQAPDTSKKPLLNLKYGGTLIEFEAEMDARYQWKKVEAKAWDYSSQKLFETQSSSTAFKDHGNIAGGKLSGVVGLDAYELQHSGYVEDGELKAWADAAMLKSRLAKIRGRARIQGMVAKLKPGEMVELGGVGERFNGNAYVTAVQQELVNGTVYTNVQFGLAPKWFYRNDDVIDAPAAGLLPAVHGLMIGKVVKLGGDPNGQDRIQVKCPVIDDKAKGVWARLASQDAGKSRGWVTRPEIGDEVIVGFVNGDPRDAIVLGQLHSGKHPAPIPADDGNNLKGYTSRSGMKMTFDDGKKVIIIKTPGGNSLTISEEKMMIEIKDQNGNSCKMDPKGIEMKSIKDIKIDAKGKIDIKALLGIKMFGGIQISAKAAALSLLGAASAKLSSAGITKIKGKLLKLN
ncbi:MAG: type VI secretion system tip protein VgrG [Saprospiraceae bacterium]|nr:type VI secretion system tip protein VgrG [Lewinella sp.]